MKQKLFDYYDPDNEENDNDDMARAAVIHVCCRLYFGRFPTVKHHLETFTFTYCISSFFVHTYRLDDSAAMRSKEWRKSATRTHSRTVMHHSRMSGARRFSLTWPASSRHGRLDSFNNRLMFSLAGVVLGQRLLRGLQRRLRASLQPQPSGRALGLVPRGLLRAQLRRPPAPLPRVQLELVVTQL